MNRVIKFRVWDREDRAFLLPEVADGMMITLNGVAGHYSDDDNDDGIMQNGKWYFPEQKFITEIYELNQYTGLEDKNKKEIYEGDILKTVHGNYAVEFSRIDAQFQFWKFDHYGMNGEFPCFWECEILGNIYENPELLKS